MQVEDAMADAAGFVNLGNAQLVDVVVRAIAAGTCSGGGYPSRSHWLPVHAGVTGSHASDIVRIAERAHEFPHVMRLFRAGKLSPDQTAAAMIATSSADRRVAEFAEVATVAQIRKFVRSVLTQPDDHVHSFGERNDDPTGAENAESRPAIGASGVGGDCAGGVSGPHGHSTAADASARTEDVPDTGGLGAGGLDAGRTRCRWTRCRTDSVPVDSMPVESVPAGPVPMGPVLIGPVLAIPVNAPMSRAARVAVRDYLDQLRQLRSGSTSGRSSGSAVVD